MNPVNIHQYHDELFNISIEYVEFDKYLERSVYLIQCFQECKIKGAKIANFSKRFPAFI